MAILAAASGFFSSSEAALFSLKPDDRRAMRSGSAAQQLAIELLGKPDLLLTAILFWNLTVNIVFFALASIIGIKLEREGHTTEAGLVAFGSLLAIILFSEMVPKTVGVMVPRTMASLVSLPLAGSVRAFRPIAPLFAALNKALRRLLFPSFVSEPYLELSDLEQAITISTSDEQLVSQERQSLQNIVLLSDLQAQELMRPRTQYQSFNPPVSLEQLGGRLTRSGYLLVTETETEEIAGAIALKYLPTVPRHHLENFAQPVVYVPWCTSVAAVFDELQNSSLEVAAVVNEYGETIGIITLEDLLHAVFEEEASRNTLLLAAAPLEQLEDNLWRVSGITGLRNLARAFQLVLPPRKSTTVGGIVQEQLQRLPEPGDRVQWFMFEFHVTDADQMGQMTVELKLLDEPTETP